jgi:hypothetical protein
MIHVYLKARKCGQEYLREDFVDLYIYIYNFYIYFYLNVCVCVCVCVCVYRSKAARAGASVRGGFFGLYL